VKAPEAAPGGPPDEVHADDEPRQHHGTIHLDQWSAEDLRANDQAIGAIHQELTERGELVGAEGLTGPDAAKIVTHDGTRVPVVTDGPFPEPANSWPATA